MFDPRQQHHILLLAVLMLLFGTVNTIANKYQDITVVGHDENGKPVYFNHPGVQSACMFLGELLCLVFYILEQTFFAATKDTGNTGLVSLQDKDQERNSGLIKALAFFVPAFCDSVGTTLLYVGLFYTYASSFQMLRGCVVLFSGLLTIVILKRKLHSHHWAGMFMIIFGAAAVGVADYLNQPAHNKGDHNNNHPHAMLLGFQKQSSPDAANPIFGNILVICAQVAAAFQFIIEEKFLSKYQVPPLKAVGLEGLWGLVICSIGLPVLGYIKDDSLYGDVVVAFNEIIASRQLIVSTSASIVSIAFFNFFGLSVTRHLSGAARATIDACRTLFIWLFALQVGWEKFHGLEVIGFLAMVVGTCIYNKIISLSTIVILPQQQQSSSTAADERSPLLSPSKQGDGGAHHAPVPIRTSANGGSGGMRYMIRSFRMGGYGSLFSSNSSTNVLGASPSPSASPRSGMFGGDTQGGASAMRRNNGGGFNTAGSSRPSSVGRSTAHEPSSLGNANESLASSVIGNDETIPLDD